MRASLVTTLIFLIAGFHHVASLGDREVSINVNKWQTVPIDRGFTLIRINNLDDSLTSVILQVTAFKPVCLSAKRECMRKFSYYGKSVGVEKILFGDDVTVPRSIAWYVSSNISQKAFIYAKGYSYAPIVGACPTSPSPLSLNPNIQINGTAFYDLLSFSYATLLVPHERTFLLSCSDRSYWPQLSYEVYVLPWNQRFEVSNPSFNRSSLSSFKQAMFHATSMNVLRDGLLIHTQTMQALEKAQIRIFKRLGLDMVVSVVVRVKDVDSDEIQEGADDTAFYVSQNVFGCRKDDLDCGIAVTIWEMIVVGIFATYGLLFVHLGRRIHRLNTFTSGFAIGSFIIYVVMSHYSNVESEVLASLSVVGGGLGLGLAVMLIFWKVKPSCKTSHIPLYLTASFLILATLFFTPLGNEHLWNNRGMFFGIFFGALAVLTLFVFVPFTKKISVDLCTALIGTYFFICGVLVIFVPGSVFPYLLLDAVNRVAIPGAHNALTITWTGYIDLSVFIAWPVLIIFFLLFNHYCSPPLEPSTQPYEELREAERQSTNWTRVDSWPPLPPDAYVSERSPLVPTASQPVGRATNASAPPPYSDSIPNDGPPSYQP